VRYREGHIWHLDQAATYQTGLRFMEGNELARLLRHGIMLALEEHQERMKYMLTSAFDDMASQIDLGGPEYPFA